MHTIEILDDQLMEELGLCAAGTAVADRNCGPGPRRRKKRKKRKNRCKRRCCCCCRRKRRNPCGGGHHGGGYVEAA